MLKRGRDNIFGGATIFEKGRVNDKNIVHRSSYVNLINRRNDFGSNKEKTELT